MTDGPQFFQTAMGRTFYEKTMPELVRQLIRLNDLLEEHLRHVARQRECRPSGKDNEH
jgi:hypothetical protein